MFINLGFIALFIGSDIRRDLDVHIMLVINPRYRWLPGKRIGTFVIGVYWDWWWKVTAWNTFPRFYCFEQLPEPETT